MFNKLDVSPRHYSDWKHPDIIITCFIIHFNEILKLT